MGLTSAAGISFELGRLGYMGFLACAILSFAAGLAGKRRLGLYSTE